MNTNTIFNVFYFYDAYLCIKYMEYIKNTKNELPVLGRNAFYEKNTIFHVRNCINIYTLIKFYGLFF